MELGKLPFMTGDGVNEALLGALPAVSRALELGCATGALGARYKAANPQSFWVGVDINEHAVDAARRVLDEAMRLDLDADAIDAVGGGFELVVLGDVLEHLRAPERLLRDLHRVCNRSATIAVCMPNMSHVSVLERFLSGDVMYDDHGLLDRTHLRFFASRSTFKMFLDSGWLPAAVARYREEHRIADFTGDLARAAERIGVPAEVSRNLLETYQLIVRGERFEQADASPPVRLVAVTPIVHQTQLELNLLRSPGLHEIGAPILPLRGATSAAAAFEHVRKQSDADWLLLSREEVYVPAGTGHALASHLSRQSPEDARRLLFGFGPLVRAAGATANAGHDLGNQEPVVVHRDFMGNLNPEAGWDAFAAGHPAERIMAPVFLP